MIKYKIGKDTFSTDNKKEQLFYYVNDNINHLKMIIIEGRYNNSFFYENAYQIKNNLLGLGIDNEQLNESLKKLSPEYNNFLSKIINNKETTLKTKDIKKFLILAIKQMRIILNIEFFKPIQKESIKQINKIEKDINKYFK